MGASAILMSREIVVAPGGEVRTTVRVRNTGGVVDQFDLQVLGAAAEWATIEPPSISLFPGIEQSVHVVFRPPRSAAVLAGRTPFAVKAASHEDVNGSAVDEGVVEVLPFDERSAELIPRTSRGRRSATHELAVDNRGNAPISVQLSGLDAEGTLAFEFEPPQLDVGPGAAQFAKIRVKPARHFWRGQNKTFAFVVRAEQEGQTPLAADGTMVQGAILPKWFWKAVIAVLALLLLLVVLWFALVKPQIKSSAKDAVAPLESRLDAASIPTLPAAGGGGGAPGGATTTTAAGGSGPSGATTTTTPSSPSTTTGSATTNPSGATSSTFANGAVSAYGNPFDTRLEVQSGTAPSASYVVPAGQTFALTDIFLQNPQGDTGRLTLSRKGVVLIDVALENIRLSDLHQIAPLIFHSGEDVTMTIACTAPGPGSAQCDDAASLSGFQQ